MPNINMMKESRFLRQQDVGSGKLVTIKDVGQENVGKRDEPEELRWCLYFYECELPLVANQTNLQICAQVLGSPETDDWIGKKIVLYTDPTIMFGGKCVGGIRIRAPRSQATAQSPAKPVFSKPAGAPAPAAPKPAPIEPGPLAQEYDEHGNPVNDDMPF